MISISSTANLSLTTLRLEQQHGHVSKKGAKNEGGGLERKQTGYSYIAPHNGNPLSLKEENVPITIEENYKLICQKQFQHGGQCGT